MSLLKNLFGGKPTDAQLPVDEMPYPEVWAEFQRIVPYRDGKMFISVLQQPEYAEALTWLEADTECPMAKGFARAVVDYFRSPKGDLTELVMVYQAESVDNWSTPPESSLKAVGQIVQITGLKAIVFYRPTPGAEHVKIEITPAA